MASGPACGPGPAGQSSPVAGRRSGPVSLLEVPASDVGRVLREGRSLPGRRVVLYALRADADANAAFVTSRRVGGAVQRNRARRILRAGWRELCPPGKGGKGIGFV